MSERKWNLFHQLEDEEKRRFLKKLSERGSFEIFRELCLFAERAKMMPFPPVVHRDKINTLASIHALFGKVRC